MSNYLECITPAMNKLVKPVRCASFSDFTIHKSDSTDVVFWEHRRQSATKLAQGEEVGLDIVPRIIERIIEERFVIVNIQNFLVRGFTDVGEEHILVITLVLINLFNRPKFFQMLTKRIKDIADESTRSHLY